MTCGKKWPLELVQEAARLRGEGYSVKGIGRKLKVSEHTVRGWIAARCPELFPPESTGGDEPEAWHLKRGSKWGKCSLCGCPYAPESQLHRRSRDGLYERRTRGDNGWQSEPCGERQPGPEQRMLLRQVAELRAQNVTWPEIADACG